MRYRVIITWHDDGAFGYTAPPIEEVIRDWLTRAEAKAIYRHYVKKHWYDENCEVSVETVFDGEWCNCSQSWAYREMEEQELWFDERGYDYYWWLQFGEIRKVG